jgi:hypothetical protein
MVNKNVIRRIPEANLDNTIITSGMVELRDNASGRISSTIL